MAEKQGTPLEQVSGLRPGVAEALRPLWITTVEELAAAAFEEKARNGLAAVLNIAQDAVDALGRELLPRVLPAVRERIHVPPQPRTTGALDRLDRDLPRDRSRALEVLPPRASLADKMPAVRNQGQRGTCVAHACAALREYLTGDRAADLSEQYLYWVARRKLITPLLKDRPGLLLAYGMAALCEHGIPPEAAWPYNPTQMAGNEEQGPPPADIERQARANRLGRYQGVFPRDTYSLKTQLAHDNPVVVTVPTFGFWGGALIDYTGTVRLPFTAEGTRSPLVRLESAHALCLVGYQDDAETPGGGYYIVRNSWGASWASQCPDGAGYFWLPYAYVERYGLTAFWGSM